MADTKKLGILGCGDFLRWMAPGIKNSNDVEVAKLFDPDKSRAEDYAAKLGGVAVDADTDILEDDGIDIVALFVPPWIRRGLIERAVASGKHILTTKPLGATVEDCKAMVEAVEQAGVQCGVIYRRTGCAPIETYKHIFDSGEVGKLALFKEDWLHHYPEWNEWATDPERNGGPFMDAMIHNMNIARYLMGRPAKRVAYFSEDFAHPDIKCNDTEFMKLDFDGGSAHLFITWAADLEVFSKEGNDREHIDIIYMITDQGWRLTEGEGPDGFTITASKEGQTKQWVAKSLPQTTFDAFAGLIDSGGENRPGDLPSIREAYEDIKIMRDAEKSLGQTVDVDVSL